MLRLTRGFTVVVFTDHRKQNNKTHLSSMRGGIEGQWCFGDKVAWSEF